MGPTCRVCDALNRHGDGAVHESCADARIFAESGGWLFLGPEVNLSTTPWQRLDAILQLCAESERVWQHNAVSSDFKIPPFDRHGVRQLYAVILDRGIGL